MHHPSAWKQDGDRVTWSINNGASTWEATFTGERVEYTGSNGMMSARGTMKREEKK